MTVTEIKALAESYVDDIIEDEDAILWTNECLQFQYATESEVYDVATIDASDPNTATPIPDNLGEIEEIRYGDGSLYRGSYRFVAGRIVFAASGIYGVTYKAIPGRVTALSDRPAVHALLVPTLALWMAMRYKQKDDDENPDANRLRFEFDKQKSMQLAAIQRKSNPSVMPMVYGM